VTEAAAASTAGPFTGRTAWARNLETPLRQFLRTETGSAAVLLGATVGALVWANAAPGSYASAWHTRLEVRIGGAAIAQDLRAWIDTGLMALFFFVVGLEARREFDMGELRERRRVALPLAAGVLGMAVPAAVFLAFNAGGPAAHGWGVAMSTDTAFALGMLALVGRRFPDRLRAFMLTVAVVDDLIALLVIAFAYSSRVRGVALAVAIALFAGLVATHVLGLRRGVLDAAFGVGAWIALHESGVDPVVIGLALGLLTFASPASRVDLERATDLFRLFREQPTPELARSAQVGVAAAISPNLRLQQLFHPWTSYAIVPLFALANAGIRISGSFLAHAYTTPVTLGVLVGYLAGKPVGVVGGAALVTRATGGRVRPPVGWAAVAGGGSIAGIGFTVSLLIAALAFHGAVLEQAKLGVLSAAVCASTLTWLVFRATALLPKRLRIRALLGAAEPLVDLAVPVDPERDHVRGPQDAPITLVEYGDFECPYCGLAEPAIRELLADAGDVRYVWRHLPLNDVHPHAQLAAEAAEAAARQGAFWELHDLLLELDDLRVPRLVDAARSIGLDVDRYTDDLREHAGAAHVAEDVDSADLSGVSGTPTFFIDGKRHNGAYDIDALKAAVRVARARAALAAPAAR
jgi:Na+/H+ antiporter NhaA